MYWLLGDFYIHMKMSLEISRSEVCNPLHKSAYCILFIVKGSYATYSLLLHFRYLDRTKSAGAEGPTFQYYWGLRAKEETNKRKVLSFVSEVCFGNKFDYQTKILY